MNQCKEYCNVNKRGCTYLNELLTVVLKEETWKLGANLAGKIIAVAGGGQLFKGRPEIVITDLADLRMKWF